MSTSPTISVVDSDFIRLADWLSALQIIFRAAGYGAVYIGGGSARDILDHLRTASPLRMRDLDLYLIRDRPVDPEDVRVLAELVVNRRLANGQTAAVRVKSRANPALPIPARYQHVTGYGIHLSAPDLPILSLGVLHSRADLALNGLFDIDAINLRLPIDGRLGVDAFTILDPHGGYAAWRRRSPRIVHWAEVQRCYVRHGLRISRCFARVGQTRLTEAFRAEHAAHRPASPAVDSLRELHRDFLKLLSGPTWEPALRMLGQLSVLDALFPAVQARLCDPTPIPDPGGATKSDRAIGRAHALLGGLSDPLSAMMLSELIAVAPSVFGDRAGA